MTRRWTGRPPALKPEEAQALRNLLARGWTQKEASALFGVHRSTAGVYARREHKRKELA